MHVDVWLDERGRRCPLPVVALMRATTAYPPGHVVAVISDDPAAEHDIPAWCRLKGATLLTRSEPEDGGPGLAFVVQLPAASSSTSSSSTSPPASPSASG